MKIPQIDLLRQYKAMKEDIDGNVAEVFTSGAFVMGKWVREIEEKVAGLMGARHGIGVASGTDALDLAMTACDVGPGDEVITSPFSFVSVAEIAITRSFGFSVEAVMRMMYGSECAETTTP